MPRTTNADAIPDPHHPAPISVEAEITIRGKSPDGKALVRRYGNAPPGSSRRGPTRRQSATPTKSGSPQSVPAQSSDLADQLTALARQLTALAHPKRLAALALAAKGSVSHAEWAKALGLQAGPLYFHVRELLHADLIERFGRSDYRLTPTGIDWLAITRAMSHPPATPDSTRRSKPQPYRPSPPRQTTARERKPKSKPK